MEKGSPVWRFLQRADNNAAAPDRVGSRGFERPVLQMEMPGAACHYGTRSDVLFYTGKTRGLESEGNDQLIISNTFLRCDHRWFVLLL
jgi:hypothetical protein